MGDLDWKERRARKRRRQRTIEQLGSLLFLHVLVFTTVLHLRGGALTGLAGNETIATLLLAALAVGDVGVVVVPARALKVATSAARTVGRFTLQTLTGVLLIAFWAVLLLPARLVGRRNFARRHPASASWVDGTSWRVSTWTGKRSEAIAANTGRGGTLLRTLTWFLSRGDTFLLIVVTLLLILLSLSIFSQNPTLAPFVYTLF